MRNYFILFCFFSNFLFAQSDKVWMIPNRGQWEKEIAYEIDLANGKMYIEKQGFTYFFHNLTDVYHAHSQNEEMHLHEHKTAKAHAIKTHFIGSNINANVIENGFSNHYKNYFIGNDRNKWKSEIYSISNLNYTNFYPDIDLEMEGLESVFKYSFRLKPKANPDLIRFEVDGADEIYIDENGNLHIKHSFGEIVEKAPESWTIDKNGRKSIVKTEFKIVKNTVSFYFPESYDDTEILLIDPELTFSTFTGSTADNWGFTATPDPSGNLLAGGIVFGAGYPVTTGAFDPTYNGGNLNGTLSGFDISITKFNAIGTQNLYSTYIGGSGNELPTSLITNEAGELFILSITSSYNFPLGNDPFQGFNNGGVEAVLGSILFTGTDIAIVRMSADGTNLIASTYIGGNDNDGLNHGSNLDFNYGDAFRGEIILDEAGNVLVSSSTRSTNFPLVSQFQGFLGGTQDAVIFKMTPNLSTLVWSTYFGGSGFESGNSLQLSPSGDLYVAGGTTSTNGLMLNGGNTQTFQGGSSDGYVIRLNPNNLALLNGTYVGTNQYDQVYFVQVDTENSVYVYGQTLGAMQVSNGVYANQNSGQFIRKYSQNLSNINWTTRIGGGSGGREISPTAFLVSICGEIYISGWGSSLNSGSTNNFPVTSDAFQSNTNGNSFYLAVLDENATGLKYGTFMGGTSNQDRKHVDGGTSRFDKDGTVYHAVCGSCGSANGFTTTPGVWSPNNMSNNCNLAAFKFELGSIRASVGSIGAYVCAGNTVVFDNMSQNADIFEWNFGNGVTSTQFSPSYSYTTPGSYTVSLIASDSRGCFSSDTAEMTVLVGDFTPLAVQPTNSICPGLPLQLNASGGETYTWSPAVFLNNATIGNPIATVFETTEFFVVISDSCGTDTLELIVPVFEVNTTVSNDTAICFGGNIQLLATGGISYSWTPTNTLSSGISPSPIATPTFDTQYYITITTQDGCIVNDSVFVGVDFDSPVPIVPPPTLICPGYPTQLVVGGSRWYYWSPNLFLNTNQGDTVIASPTYDFVYVVDFINACGSAKDSVFLNVYPQNISASPNSIVCPNESILLQAFGGVNYTWSPSETLDRDTGSVVIASPLIPTTYRVIGLDTNNCIDTVFISVFLYPKPSVDANANKIFLNLGEEVLLFASGSSALGTYEWTPRDYLSCNFCQNTSGYPNQNITYTIIFTDENGCKATDFVNLYYTGMLYVPNTFTPNGNQYNEIFKAEGSNIKEFKMEIYNRWGELIKTLDSIDDFWDGTYNGQDCPIGTYVWKLRYSDFTNNDIDKVGHVNLLR
jgi:gliding motility-associated-like protein